MSNKIKTISVSLELAHHVNELERLLKLEFGCDFAYTILGRGVIIGASNMAQGSIGPVPTIKKVSHYSFQAGRIVPPHLEIDNETPLGQQLDEGADMGDSDYSLNPISGEEN